MIKSTTFYTIPGIKKYMFAYLDRTIFITDGAKIKLAVMMHCIHAQTSSYDVFIRRDKVSVYYVQC